MTHNATLGFHRVGDYHYFTILGEGNMSFGAASDDEFLTHDSFAGLITAVHEHYHLMQEMLQGYSWWRQDTTDKFCYAAMLTASALTSKASSFPLLQKPDEKTRQLVLDPDDPASLAQKLWLELKNIDRYTQEARFTRVLLDAEVKETPELKPFLSDEAYDLTTLDLIECQAAILTELYMTKLIEEHPEKFDQRVITDLAPLYRVDRMIEGYQRPLRVLLHICEAAKLQFQLPRTNVHSFYRQIKHGPVYFLLAFLLDYALHLPPDPLLLFWVHRDGATQQDIYPVFRFINLAMLWLMETMTGGTGVAKTLINERLYYSEASNHLAACVNRTHGLVRPPNSQPTFFSIQETTERWASNFHDSPMRDFFPIFGQIRQACWVLRKEDPGYWTKLNPLGFDLRIELPRIVVHANGMRGYPYIADKDQVLSKKSKEEFVEVMRDYVTPYFTALHGMPWQQRDDLPATVYPNRFIEETMKRQMLFRLSEAILFEGHMRCPLTDGLGRFVPCEPRTPACERITGPDSLPSDRCLLRDVATQYFGDINHFEKEKRGWLKNLLGRK